RRDEIEARNKADQSVYGAERMLKDAGDKLTAADRQAIETAIENAKKANESNDPAAIQKALEQLTAVQHKAAEALYKQGAAGSSSGAPGGDAGAGAGAAAGSAPKSDVI